MARRAGSTFLNDVASMLGKALIGENASAPVTLVAQSVRMVGLDGTIFCRVVAFKKIGMDGTMRAIGPSAACTRSGIIVVTISAPDH